jgi:hypothetical protein
MTSYADSLDMVAELSAELEAQGVDATATNDPRSATPPCIVIAPPSVAYDFGCGGTGAWQLQIMAPGTPNADAWKLLDEIEAVAIKLYPIERRDTRTFQISSDGPSSWGYLLTMEKGIQ